MKNKDKLLIVATGVMALSIPAAVSVLAAQPNSFYIASGSMRPTLLVDSRIRVQANPYENISQVRRGDIIIHTGLDKPSGRSFEFVKRVVGLPGDKVRLSGTKIFVNGHSLPHVAVRRVGKIAVFQETNGQAKYQVQYGDSPSPSPTFSGTVPSNQLFCLGDNRDNANDSRYIGSVPFTDVVSKKLP